MQLPTVLALRHFSDFTEHAGAFIPTVKPINYRAWTTTLFCAPWICSCGIGTEAGQWLQEKSICNLPKGGHAWKCILHRVTCRGRTLTRWRAFLRTGCWPSDVEKNTRRKKRVAASRITHREKKTMHPECGGDRRMTRERKLSILPVHRRLPANDIDFIQLCRKYLPDSGAAENYAASCRRESLEGIRES